MEGRDLPNNFSGSDGRARLDTGAASVCESPEVTQGCEFVTPHASMKRWMLATVSRE